MPEDTPPMPEDMPPMPEDTPPELADAPPATLPLPFPPLPCGDRLPPEPFPPDLACPGATASVAFSEMLVKRLLSPSEEHA